MTTPLISAILDAYEKSLGKNPKTAIRMVMWLMIYDEEGATWARDLLEVVSIFGKPENDTIRANQLRKVDRWRSAAENSTGLPPRGKKGGSEDYRQALAHWKALNPRPTRDQLLAGWTPRTISPEPDVKEAPRKGKAIASGKINQTGSATSMADFKTQTDSPPESPQPTVGIGRTSASELTAEYLEGVLESRRLLDSDEV